MEMYGLEKTVLKSAAWSLITRRVILPWLLRVGAAISNIFEKHRWYLRPRVRSGSLSPLFVFDLPGGGMLTNGINMYNFSSARRLRGRVSAAFLVEGAVPAIEIPMRRGRTYSCQKPVLACPR